jgi:hypothetical protein
MTRMKHPDRPIPPAGLMLRLLPELLPFLCAVSWLAVGCAADQSATSDSNGARAGGTATARQPYRIVFVIGVAHSPDVRKTFEDEFVRQLEAQGVRGIASYAVLPDASALTRDQVVRAVRGSAAEGVIVTRLLKREQQHTATFSAGGYYTHYSSAARSVYAPPPPALSRSEVVTLETRLFDVGGEQMIWTTTSEGFDPQATRSVIARLVRGIVNDLTKAELIQAETNTVRRSQ